MAEPVTTYNFDPAVAFQILIDRYGQDPIMEARIRAAQLEATVAALLNPADPDLTVVEDIADSDDG